ncbi:MAG: porin [Nitrospinota bacterium]
MRRRLLVFTSLLGIAFFIGLLAAPSRVAGSELLDLLRKKGVITEEEYRELRAADRREKARVAAEIEKARPPFEVKYKGGFRITSRDKRFELRLGVQVFTQASFFPGDADADNDFLARRGRVTLRGKVFRDFTYRLELDGTASPVLDQDAYLGWERYKGFRIRVGQHKTRFGGEQTWSRYSLFFLERSLISDNLTEGASRGVFVFGDLTPRFSYEASVSNGTGRASDNNDEKDFAIRLIGRPFKGTPWAGTLPIEVAVNAAFGDQPFSATGGRVRLFLRDNRLTVFSVSTEGFRTRFGGDVWYNKDYKNKGGLPLSATAEFIYERQERQGANLGRGLDDLIRYGFHVQGGYLVTGSRKKNGLELVAKFERIDMEDEDTSSGDDIAGQTVDVYGFGVNYWPIGEVRLSVDGFIFDTDRAVAAASDDPFQNGDTAWAIVTGFYFKF